MRRSVAAVMALVLLAGMARGAENPAFTPAVKNPERHTRFLDDIKAMNGDISLVFVGDSITDGWRGKGKEVWQKEYAPLKALNLGIGGDRTQHVLWRMQNGELDGYKAKLFVLMIGTNNGGDSAENVAAGVEAIVKEIRTRQPQARVLLLGIFPRSVNPDKKREKNDETNKILAKLDDGKTITYLDIGEKFLAADKSLPKDIMPDALHPNAKGYEIWAEAIRPTLQRMMGAK
jgi:lysophospholipase L1-like esterase